MSFKVARARVGYKIAFGKLVYKFENDYSEWLPRFA